MPEIHHDCSLVCNTGFQPEVITIIKTRMFLLSSVNMPERHHGCCLVCNTGFQPVVFILNIKQTFCFIITKNNKEKHVYINENV